MRASRCGRGWSPPTARPPASSTAPRWRSTPLSGPPGTGPTTRGSTCPAYSTAIASSTTTAAPPPPACTCWANPGNAAAARHCSASSPATPPTSPTTSPPPQTGETTGATPGPNPAGSTRHPPSPPPRPGAHHEHTAQDCAGDTEGTAEDAAASDHPGRSLRPPLPADGRGHARRHDRPRAGLVPGRRCPRHHRPPASARTDRAHHGHQHDHRHVRLDALPRPPLAPALEMAAAMYLPFLALFPPLWLG